MCWEEVSGDKVAVVVKRHNYPRPVENGLGLVVISPATSHSEIFNKDKKNGGQGNGLKTETTSTTESQEWWCPIADDQTDVRDLLSLKWTQPLLLGSAISSAALIRRKGVVEVVESRYMSWFQSLYDHFTSKACSFSQVGPYHRFWVSSDCDLRLLLAKPQQPSDHPEWRELFLCPPGPGGGPARPSSSTSAQIQRPDLNFRILGRRIGYFINDITEGRTMSSFYSAYLARKAKKTKGDGQKSGSGSGSGSSSTSTSAKGAPPSDAEAFEGLQLYRCWSCNSILLKPLQCGRCKSVAYCSRACQHDHWHEHKQFCEESSQE
eukprot:TRINITY_DN3875_c0_g1_i4.p1 TRINITY_DN3875_c0_g1~~TRINITY_DN3875_c0_g1_i4.p1  ORF type:complete len:321 (-),score=55.65 TRINITY_DN3875_c0_g1_i4:117-1079(-)